MIQSLPIRTSSLIRYQGVKNLQRQCKPVMLRIEWMAAIRQNFMSTIFKRGTIRRLYVFPPFSFTSNIIIVLLLLLFSFLFFVVTSGISCTEECSIVRSVVWRNDAFTKIWWGKNLSLLLKIFFINLTHVNVFSMHVIQEWVDSRVCLERSYSLPVLSTTIN